MDKKRLLRAFIDNNPDIVHEIMDREAERIGFEYAKKAVGKGECTVHGGNLEDLLHDLLEPLDPAEYKIAIEWIHTKMDLSIILQKLEEGRQRGMRWVQQ